METLLQVRVAARKVVAEDVVAFEFAPLDGVELPGFEAGAHIDVHVPGGPVRQYSLYQLPDSLPRYCIGVLRDPQSRGGSVRLIDGVKEGDILSISRPRNHFQLHSGPDHAMLFAGGIGITPIMCMAEQLAREGRSFELHYSGRTPARMAFLDRLRSAGFADRVQVHSDDGAADQLLDARAVIGSPVVDRQIYVCGPTGFMDHVLSSARELGWGESHLHREYFAAAPIDHSTDGPFEIELSHSGRCISVKADQSAAQALIDAGVPLSLSCEAGVCGTCQTRVLAGVPDHRDLYLTDEEKHEHFMPCCSRSCTPRLVLDL
ncbi:vanillate O-demethylase ferredoxin subunit [Acidovorax sp. 100]|uniref:PDR/VanB family oxidoreductase n=1 Tax=Acidovorax sp. 100 TaxID=2135635 RepID=UPI000EF9FAE5|nr:PDR/VanB family oxidoreductase [Acidovorax sp. 100]RMA59950.1 vanillate O-demethylase ferredoxin subunit [Acidovorax sp. 100]